MHKFLDNRLANCRTGTVTVQKDSKNMIGLTIGGGSPQCPLLYVVQIFENGPIFKSGVLEPGDEIITVNGTNCRGWSKNDLAKYIQSFSNSVLIGYSKLDSKLQDGSNMDILLKKLKHKFVENVSYDTADALGLSRAVLSQDQMKKKVEELELSSKSLKTLKALFTKNIGYLTGMGNIFTDIGRLFSEISVHEINGSARDSFDLVAQAHRFFGSKASVMIEETSMILDKIDTYLNKTIPDIKLSLTKYLNDKFLYLSYCLKVKETEEEEADYIFDDDIAKRLNTGNYEYRVQLRFRFLSKQKFIKSRNDLLEKFELLDNKNGFYQNFIIPV